MRTTPHRLVWVLAGALLFGATTWTARAHAQDTKEEEGAVIAFDEGDLVIDLGKGRGATEGAIVELWRPLKIKHPVTGQMVSDRIRIGSLRLGQVRKHMSLARPEGQLLRSVAAGDVVVLVVPKPEASKPGKPAPPPKAETTDKADKADRTDKAGEPGKRGEGETDPEARELSDLFSQLRGTDLPTRIRAYEGLVRKNPKGKFAGVLYEEAQALRRLHDAMSNATPPAPKAPQLVGWEAPEGLTAGGPVSLGFEIIGAHGAVLHVKHPGEPQYTSLPLAAAGRGYWTVTVPEAQVTSAGLELFVETVSPDGKAAPLLGNAEKPVSIRVDAPPGAPEHRRIEALASLWTDFAFYNSPQKRNDYLSQTEAVFGARLGDTGLRALRTGFGVYRGASGSLDELDQKRLSPRSVGLTYGYLEIEHAPAPSFAFIGRGAIGLDDRGITGGAQAFVRIGHDKKTNLMLGGEALGGVGVRGIVQLEWRTIPRVPILLRTEVTNQPAGTRTSNGASGEAQGKSEVGARAIAQVGYQITQGIEVSLRGSYQGRTINHAGPGVGAGVTYTW